MPTLEHSAKVFQYSKDQGNHSVGHITQYSMSDVVEDHATIYVLTTDVFVNYKTYVHTLKRHG